MTKIIEGVRFIPGQDEFIPDAHVYLLGEPASKDLSLVDAGLVGKGDYKIRTLQAMKIDLTHVKRIILTHTHLDHIGCLSEIQRSIPWAELWIHTQEADSLEKGDERTVYGMDMFKDMCQAQYGLKPGTFRLKATRKLKDGEVLKIGAMAWDVFHIPGHSMGSIGLYNREHEILIPGDVVYADYSIGRFDLHGADAAELRKSLLRLAGLEVHILLPGHNRIVQTLPKGYISKTVKQWESYLI